MINSFLYTQKHFLLNTFNLCLLNFNEFIFLIFHQGIMVLGVQKKLYPLLFLDQDHLSYLLELMENIFRLLLVDRKSVV